MSNPIVRRFQPIPENKKETMRLESYEEYVQNLPETQGVKWIQKSTNKSKTAKEEETGTTSTNEYQRYKKARAKKLWTKYYACHRAGGRKQRTDVVPGGVWCSQTQSKTVKED